MDDVAFVCNGLALTGFSALGKCFGEKCKHFFDALTLEEAVGGEVAGHAQGNGVVGRVGAEDGYADYFHRWI